MKKRLSLAIPLLIIMAVTLFAKGRNPVTILYTNDVHTYIVNTVKDKDGNKVPGLSYGSVVALRDDLKAQGQAVALVDAGDHIQGTAYGAMDEGLSIIKFMNAAKYDVATLGNHEFDYGTDRLLSLIKVAKYPYVACNFVKASNNKSVTPAFKVVKVGKTKVAFVGIMTPETYTKSTPAYFMDKERTKFIYKIAAGEDGRDLYDCVQKAIDQASKKADYVVALGHLGDDPASAPWTSLDVIANTHGLDAFIDGHSHSTVEMKFVKDSTGKDVLLSQTGCYFAAIGCMTLDDTKASSKLLTSYSRSDEKIDALVKEWANQVDQRLNEEIAIADLAFYVNDPESKNRLVRSQETNTGDFVADAAYYYFNEVEQLTCDLAIANGGGLRSDLPTGSYSYSSAKKVQPFGNVMCLVEVTGQELLDALEFGARLVGSGECGGFLQVAGLKYSIDPSVPNTIKTSAEGLWAQGPSEYRVKDVFIYNRESESYEPLDLSKVYTMGGLNYTLRNMGDGFAMLSNAKLVKDYVGEDYLMTAAYAKAFAKGQDGKSHISSKNSPLSSWKNYLLDYENPLGSGRITIIEH